MDTEFLTKKYGPLPGWAYIGIVGVPVVYFVFKGGGKKPPTAAQPAGSPMPQYDAGPVPYGGGGGGSPGGGGGSNPFDPSGIIAAIQSGNETLLNTISQQNASYSSNFNTALGSLQQALVSLGNQNHLTTPSAVPQTSYIAPYTPPPVSQPQPQYNYVPPSVPTYSPPPVYNYNSYTPSTLPQGSYQQTYGGYVPVNPGPLINTNNYADPRWNGTTVFNGNGQVWHGLVPA